MEPIRRQLYLTDMSCPKVFRDIAAQTGESVMAFIDQLMFFCGAPSRQSIACSTLLVSNAEFDPWVFARGIPRHTAAAAFHCPVLAGQGQVMRAAITLRT